MIRKLNNDNGLQDWKTKYQAVTGRMFYCRDSEDFCVSASNKLPCNLTGQCFEMSNVSSTRTLGHVYKKPHSMRKNIYILIILLFYSCSAPKLTITSKFDSPKENNENKSLIVFGKNWIIPDSSIVVGEFKTRGNFFTSMDYRVNQSLDLVKKATNNLNCNAIRIDEIKFPGPFRSKSFDIKGKILLLKKVPKYYGYPVKNTNDKNKRYIKIYRPNKIFGSGISFPVFLNEQFLFAIDNDSKSIIELSKDLKNINIEIESYNERFNVQIDNKFSGTIYIKCEVDGGGNPKVKIEETDIGEETFNEIKNMP